MQHADTQMLEIEISEKKNITPPPLAENFDYF